MDRVSVSGILVRSCLQTVSILSPSLAVQPLNMLSTNCCWGLISDPKEVEADVEADMEYGMPYVSDPALPFATGAGAEYLSEEGSCYGNIEVVNGHTLV